MAKVNMSQNYAKRLDNSIKYTEGFNESPNTELGLNDADNPKQFAKITAIATGGSYTEYKAIEVFFNNTTGLYEELTGNSHVWDSDAAADEFVHPNLVSLRTEQTAVGTIVSVEQIELKAEDLTLEDDFRYCFNPGGGGGGGSDNFALLKITESISVSVYKVDKIDGPLTQNPIENNLTMYVPSNSRSRLPVGAVLTGTLNSDGSYSSMQSLIY